MEQKEPKKLYLRCLRCGKKLKKQEYKEIGYGPICYEKVKNKKERKLF